MYYFEEPEVNRHHNGLLDFEQRNEILFLLCNPKESNKMHFLNQTFFIYKNSYLKGKWQRHNFNKLPGNN